MSFADNLQFWKNSVKCIILSLEKSKNPGTLLCRESRISFCIRVLYSPDVNIAFTAAFRRCQKSFLLNKNIATAFADNFHYELVVAHHMHIAFCIGFFLPLKFLGFNFHQNLMFLIPNLIPKDPQILSWGIPKFYTKES